MIMYRELGQHKEKRGDIAIGLIGAGQMGTGLICQCETVIGMRVAAVCARSVESCLRAYAAAGIGREEIAVCSRPSEAHDAIAAGKRVIAENSGLITEIDNIDVVVEATGAPSVGVDVALSAIEAGKPIVQMNVEADSAVGFALQKKAEKNGVVYTLSTGDEPGSCMDLYDFAATLGFPVVCAGKGKNNRVRRHARPDDPAIIEKAERFGMNPVMLASFVDGSKTMAEMTCLANALGFSIDKRGMRGPDVTPDTLADTFKPKSDGGILDSTGVVEYGNGVAPGVFVVIRVDHPKPLLDFRYLALGEGPYYALFRPYHLVSLETPIAVYRACLHKQSSIHCRNRPTCEAVVAPKRNLKAGTPLGVIGGENYYALIEKKADSDAEELLPMALAEEGVLLRDIDVDRPIRRSDVELNEKSSIVKLRREQDALLNELA